MTTITTAAVPQQDGRYAAQLRCDSAKHRQPSVIELLAYPTEAAALDATVSMSRHHAEIYRCQEEAPDV